MTIFSNMTRTDAYVQVKEGTDNTMVFPADSVIFVKDNSGFVSLKTVGSRKTIGLIPESAYDDGGDEPEE